LYELFSFHIIHNLHYFIEIIEDIVERSIRDVLVVVPDGIKPLKDGVIVQAKPYVPYVSKVSFHSSFQLSDCTFGMFPVSNF